ncbi:uncharacterized protein MYCFIDRAFT_205145 [Pseudocercospora fijiensis CIRAD86]|uniref:Biotin-protein ligase N-terminal domain-containing protein n=1 Tax=Pseudocercospora fijiensis (strain CIRAD86) TaxID=383855 RepID=M2ZHX1_PSEFD|nr:uncharacterized protein MYCFIDRAFT_205145 [Pseudocercospora fijiensis CIRAD86]EME78709.1 hypothetical protein MYCFIDRAFT_205145 [Pseudocercospora fijiensis CIRAD86]
MMLFQKILSSAVRTAIIAAESVHGHTFKALVYRGPAACDGCPEAVAQLLKSTPGMKIDVTYVGPDEEVKLNAEALEGVDVYVQPGGGDDVDETWKTDMKQYYTEIRHFVENGGRYLGFCLGAYLAGHTPGFDLLNKGDDVNTETERKGSQVTNTNDTIIQVDWTFASGKVEMKRWLYFQDGAVMVLGKNSDAKVLGRYSSNGDPAATLNQFGDGWVGLVGPHPEADKSWYADEDFVNPDGIKFDIGHDFVQTVLNAGHKPETYEKLSVACSPS